MTRITITVERPGGTTDVTVERDSDVQALAEAAALLASMFRTDLDYAVEAAKTVTQHIKAPTTDK